MGQIGDDAARQARPPLCQSDRASQPLPLVCIGASTGGLPVIQEILSTFPADGPPTLVVQHIRGEFSAGAAARLDRACRIEVLEAFEGAPILPGRAYLAPGNAHHLEVRGRVARICHLVTGSRISGHRPAVDALFASAAAHAATGLVGVLLTGMGRDGARGLLDIRRRGGHTIVQDQASSVVFGMPRAAIEIGAAHQVLPAQAIAKAILAHCATGDNCAREVVR